MLTIADMRETISKVYSTKTWPYRVSIMPDSQVIAIYYSFLERGKFDAPEKEEFHQITLEEYLEKGAKHGNKIR